MVTICVPSSICQNARQCSSSSTAVCLPILPQNPSCLQLTHPAPWSGPVPRWTPHTAPTAAHTQQEGTPHDTPAVQQHRAGQQHPSSVSSIIPQGGGNGLLHLGNSTAAAAAVAAIRPLLRLLFPGDCVKLLEPLTAAGGHHHVSSGWMSGMRLNLLVLLLAGRSPSGPPVPHLCQVFACDQPQACCQCL